MACEIFELQTAQKSQGWLRFRRFFDRKDRSDEINHFQKQIRANVVQKLRANVENLRASVVVVVAGVGGMAEPLNPPHRSRCPGVSDQYVLSTALNAVLTCF